jgi:hypothetical protein
MSARDRLPQFPEHACVVERAMTTLDRASEPLDDAVERVRFGFGKEAARETHRAE